MGIFRFKIYKILLIILLCFCNISYAAGPFTKFGRGLANTATGWAEIPFTMFDVSEDHDYAVGIFAGLPLGVVKALIRTVVGIYEIVTFPFPFPNNYEPIVEPEFIIESDLEDMRPHRRR